MRRDGDGQKGDERSRGERGWTELNEDTYWEMRKTIGLKNTGERGTQRENGRGASYLLKHK